MKRALHYIFNILLTIVLVVWIGLIVVEYLRFQKEESMLVVVKTEEVDFDGGKAYVNTGLGYKTIVYDGVTQKGREFGHMFIKVRDNLNTK